MPKEPREPAPTNRPLAFVPGQDTRPGIVLLRLHEWSRDVNGGKSVDRLANELLLHRSTVVATLNQLKDAMFINRWYRLTYEGRRYLAWILGRSSM